MKKFLKSCGIFRRPEGYYIFGNLDTPYGSIAVPPATKLPLTTAVLALGDEIASILSRLPDHQVEIDLASREYEDHLKELGFRRSSLFEKKASFVSICYDGDSYTVAPYQKAARGGFVAMKSTTPPARKLQDASPEELGKAVFSAFEAAEKLPPAEV